MRKLINIFIFVLISTFFISCKKQEYHKITFEITFLDLPTTGASNFLDIGIMPKDNNLKGFDRFNIPKVWRYDYIMLEKGNFVQYRVSPQLGYHFEMKIFIDDQLVSYRRVKTSDVTYYLVHVEEAYGRNEDPSANEEAAIISFRY